MIVAVVPVKALASAKSRLAPRLADDARKQLVLAMLGDVLAALTTCPALAAVWVIACDPEVGRVATTLGAEWLPEGESVGYNEAVAWAARRIAALPGAAMLVIPGDIPGLSADEVLAIIDALPRGPRAAVLVPSGDGRGTNAALLAPASAFTLCFGEPSFERHCQLARAAGVNAAVLHLNGAALDLDTPDDLARFIERSTPTQTRTLLEQFRAELDVGDRPALR